MSLLLLFGGVSGPATQTLTQDSRFDNSNSLAYAHTLAPGTVTLTQSATFTNSNSLAYTHRLTLYLTPDLFTNANSLAYAHTLNQVTALTQSATFTNTNSLAFAHTLTPGTVTLTASLFTNTNALAFTHQVDLRLTQSATFQNDQSFYAHALVTGQALTQAVTYQNAQTFYAHTLTQDGVTQPVTGGDDVPDRGHRGYGTKRATLKRKREREFDEQVRDIYRTLTGDPRTAERAEAIIAPIAPPVPAQGESRAAFDAAASVRAETLRRRADAMDAQAVQAEIALRLLYRELREQQDREDTDDLQQLLPVLIGMDVQAFDTPRQQMLRDLWDDEFDMSAIEALLAQVL